MRDVPIALEVLSFPLPLRQRFIRSCHLKRSACTFKSCVAFGEEANSLQWLKNLLWSFHVVKLWISWHQHCNFHCSHDSSEKDAMSSAQPTGQKNKLHIGRHVFVFSFSPHNLLFRVAKNRKDKNSYCFIYPFPRAAGGFQLWNKVGAGSIWEVVWQQLTVGENQCSPSNQLSLVCIPTCCVSRCYNLL